MGALIGVWTRFTTFVGKIVLTYRREKRVALAGSDSVARELEHNARAAEHWHQNQSIQSVQQMLRFQAWERAEGDLHLFLSRTSPAIWEDLTTAYDDLRLTEAKGAVPPTPEALRDLAERLRAADL